MDEEVVTPDSQDEGDELDELDGCDVPIEEETPDEELPITEGGVA